MVMAASIRRVTTATDRERILETLSRVRVSGEPTCDEHARCCSFPPRIVDPDACYG
jgi:hypothetical protein